MDSLEQLAQRVEALTGPCRETDALIWLLVGEERGSEQTDERGLLVIPSRDGVSLKPSCQSNGRTLGQALQWCDDHNRSEIVRVADIWGVPAFTASLDAAMTLVPDGMRRRTQVNEDGRAACWLWWPTDPPPSKEWGALFASEEMAVVAAALRARKDKQ